MLCGNTAAVNNYEVEQERLEREGYEKDQDCKDIAQELLSGGFHVWGKSTYTIDDVIDQVEQDGDYRDVIKAIAIAYSKPSEQAQLLKRFNDLVSEKAFNLAQVMEA